MEADRKLQPLSGSLARRFEQMAARYADRTALTWQHESCSYAALDRMANGVAHALLQQSIASHQVVALYLDRSFDLIAAMLGVWKAGCAYLPIEVTSPSARTEHIVSSSRSAVVITDAAHAASLEGTGVQVLLIDRIVPAADAPQSRLQVEEDDLAYVIYTSGSTGKPKGVMVTHHNVRRLFDETEPWFHFTEADVWTMFHSAAFDFSVWEIWGALLYGGRLVLVPHAVSRSPEDFYALLAEQHVTVLNQTPTALTMLIDAEGRVPQRDLSLRLIILGGEALQLAALAPFYRRHADKTPQIVNMYGITETTVHVTARFLREEEVLHATDSLIGAPIPDLRLYLLDDRLQPVAQGDTGEICVAGPGVAKGYLYQPELTATRFVADTVANDGSLMYRSGDLGRMRDDGELVYLGRADHQVKVSGFRIELGEVESVLAACPGVGQICVIAHTDAAAGTRLAAYFVSRDDACDVPAVSRYAETALPAYMRPAFYIPLDAMPINANGKVDRTALPSPLTYLASSHSAFSPTEERVAAAWRQTLQVDVIDAETNFFDAGGNSLLLVSLRHRLQQEFGRDIPVTWIFEATTIRAFAARLESTTAQGTASSSQAQRQRQAFANFGAKRGAAR